jgi:uncharacterized protein YndB with AHSA1/START domain
LSNSNANALHRFEQTVMISAAPHVVWETLVRPERMKEWLGEPELELEIATDWRIGGPIVIRGFHYARFENQGIVLRFDEPKRLSYTHLSSLSRLPDRQESYTTLDFALKPVGDATALTLTMTNFPTTTIFKHLEFYWKGTLGVLKRYAEKQ